MLPLPVRPEALPDELIGHRLARIIDMNGLESKHVLMKWLGFERSQRGSQLMDVTVLTQRWIDVADKLLIDVNELIGQHCTKPYWACFYTEQKGEQLIGDPRLSELHMPEVVLFGRSRTRHYLQLCPRCMIEDEQTYGTA